jgi:Zn-dependent oligopeptidase
LFDLDAERIREYFPLRHVVAQMLSLYQEVLGVTFRAADNASLWHPDTELFEVVSRDAVIGHFALDLHPRKGKYGHAAAFPITLGRTRRDGSRVTGFVALVCNFPKPTPSAPSLLTHDEVETLLHEFGHVMHTLLSGGRWQQQNGFMVPLDFVEALSQLFEEWAWDTRVLARLTRHYVTGEPMPEPMRSKLIAARRHLQASELLQLAMKALYDLTIHSQQTDSPVSADNLSVLYRRMKYDIEETPIPDTSLFPAGWGHMADYDAGYYSYLWSKVYAVDMYTQFAPDPVSSVVGDRYRRAVLEPGASRPELSLVRDFLGREPSEAPFLAALGIGGRMDN